MLILVKKTAQPNTEEENNIMASKENDLDRTDFTATLFLQQHNRLACSFPVDCEFDATSVTALVNLSRSNSECS